MKDFIKRALSDGQDPSSTRLNVAIIAWSVIGAWFIAQVVYTGIWAYMVIKGKVPFAPPLLIVMPWVIFAILGTAMGIKEFGSIADGIQKKPPGP